MAPKEGELKFMRTFCKSCSQPMEVEVPEHYVRKEECKCGLTADARAQIAWARVVKILVISFFLCILGCCGVKHYYTTEAVRAMHKDYEVKYLAPAERDFFNDPEYEVKKKEPAQAPAKPEAPSRGPIDPRAPHPPKGDK